MLHFETIESGTLQLLKDLQALPVLAGTRLVGDTSLALQLGHRKSIDIDLFGTIVCDEQELLAALGDLGKVTIIKESTFIHIYLINGVKVDIVNYRYRWLKPDMEVEQVRLASLEDIAAMKIAAIIGRGTKKDFIDIAYLLQFYSLDDILQFYEWKYPDGSIFVALKSLAYFDDAESDPMPYMFSELTWEDAKRIVVSKL